MTYYGSERQQRLQRQSDEAQGLHVSYKGAGC